MSLTLRLVPPSGGEATSLTVDKGVFGRDLMSRVEEVLKVPTDSQLLFFQNGSRNAAKRVVDAEKARGHFFLGCTPHVCDVLHSSTPACVYGGCAWHPRERLSGNRRHACVIQGLD